jgi:hypothetical protein
MANTADETDRLCLVISVHIAMPMQSPSHGRDVRPQLGGWRFSGIDSTIF